MNIVTAAANALTRTNNAAVAVAGAAGGAVMNGVAGAVRGSASGMREGVREGSHFTSAAALTIGLLGVAGVVEWPVLVGIGATAVILRQIRFADTQPVVLGESVRDASVSPITTVAAATRTPPRKMTEAQVRKAATRKAATRKATVRAPRTPTKR